MDGGINEEVRVDDEIYHLFDDEVRDTRRPSDVDKIRAFIAANAPRLDAALRQLGWRGDLRALTDTQTEEIELDEIFTDPTDPDEALARISRTLDEFLKLKRQEDAEDTTDMYARKNFKLAVFVGVVTGIGGIIATASLIQSIVAAVGSNTPPAPTGDPDIDAKLKELYAYVKNTSDDEFWDQMAAFVTMPRTWTLYLADELAFMNYVMDWFPFLGQWVWAKPQDKLDFVDTLVLTYDKDGVGAMYREVKTFSYPGDPTRDGAVQLPRAVAADVVRLAVAQVIADMVGPTHPRLRHQHHSETGE